MTEPLFLTLFLATLAGATIPLGGALGSVSHILPRWLENEFRHGAIAFGGGLLLAGVSLVLVPEGMENLPLPLAALAFVGGGIVFMLFDRAIQTRGKSVSQFMAMLLDFVPEAIAMGALLTTNKRAATMLALIIALQNVPESFNAYRELISAGRFKKKSILFFFFVLVALGPALAYIGYAVLAEKATAISMLMLFAAGGILYIIFQDIAPQSVLKRHWGPPFGAVLGFLLGLIGNSWIGM